MGGQVLPGLRLLPGLSEEQGMGQELFQVEQLQPGKESLCSGR